MTTYNAHSYGSDIANQKGQIAQHAFAKEILRESGWDIAFPDSPISPVDAFAYTSEVTLRFQIKYCSSMRCPTSNGVKFIVPLKNGAKRVFRKDHTTGIMNRRFLYFENNIDCIYAYVPELDKGIFVYPSMVTRGQTMFHVRVSAPTRLTKRCRMWYHYVDFKPKEIMNGSSYCDDKVSMAS